MAKYATLDAYVEIASGDMSDHVESIDLQYATADIETTAMGDNWETRIAGIKSWRLQINFHQDHAASEVDATLWPIVTAGTAVAIEIRSTSDAVSASNPKWTGNVSPTGDYAIVSGSVGDLAKTAITWPGTGALTRATS